MQRIAKFEKVSFEQFEKDWLKCFPDTTNVKEIYDNKFFNKPDNNNKLSQIKQFKKIFY